jgi:hypothetical protein
MSKGPRCYAGQYGRLRFRLVHDRMCNLGAWPYRSLAWGLWIDDRACGVFRTQKAAMEAVRAEAARIDNERDEAAAIEAIGHPPL